MAALFGYEDEMVRQFIRGLRATLHDDQQTQLPPSRLRYYGRNLPGPEVLGLVRSNLIELLGESDRPTAVFCGNQIDAEQVYLVALELGMQVPRDLSIVHFGGKWRNGALAQRLACVAVDEHEVGVRAGQLLCEMRAGKRPLDSCEKHCMPISLLEGETLGVALQDTAFEFDRAVKA